MGKSIDTGCQAFRTAIEVLGRPWTGLLIANLQGGPLRYSELAERTHGCGDKTLSARLKELEARGIIERTVEPGPPVRVVYALTSRGVAFQQVGEAIQRWGHELVAEPPPRRKKA